MAPLCEIRLSSRKYPGMMATVDAADYERLSPYRWFPAKRKRRSGHVCWYAWRWEGRRVVLMHRQVLGLPIGRVPEVDHENGDGLQNVQSNLRTATPRQNRQHQLHYRPNKTSRHKGVSKDRRPLRKSWCAKLQLPSGKTLHIGRFATEEEAARAYDRAARLHFGEFAACNFC